MKTLLAAALVLVSATGFADAKSEIVKMNNQVANAI